MILKTVLIEKLRFPQWFKMPNSIWKLFWRLYSLEKRFWHTTGLLRHQKIQKKYKRPMKVVKAKSKARRWKITKVYNFFTFLGSLGFFYCMIFIFLSFKDKRPTKVVKATLKARGWPKTKFQNFFTFLGSLGVFYCKISTFLSFKVIKVKKAALVAGAAFLYLWKFIVSKLLL